MKRRTLLRRSAALGAIAVAGCTGDGDTGNGNGNGNGDGTPTGSPTGTPTGFSGFGDYSTRTTNTGCDDGSAGTAAVAFDAEEIRLTITGIIESPTPCYEASFEGVKYDSDTDELRVTIAAEADGSDVCMECVGAIEYETTLNLEGGFPGTVVVKHGTGNAAAVVATASPDA